MKTILRGFPLLTLSLLLLFGYLPGQKGFAANSTPYPAPGNLAGTAPNWNVWVDNQPAPTWYYNYRTAASFEFVGSTTVTVQYTGGPISSAKVMPSQYGIPVTINGNTVTFTLTDNTKGKVVLRINDDVNSEIFILGSPPAPAVPPGAVEFWGDVNPGATYQIQSNTTYYFHPGALVHTSFQGNNVNNVTFMGPGVLSAPSNGGGTIEIYGGSGITLDDIIVTSEKTQQATHNIYLRTNISNVTIKNLKLLSYNQSGDGIAIGGANGVTLTDSFINASDDLWDIGWSGTTSNLSFNNNVAYFSDVSYPTTGESGIIHIQGIEPDPSPYGNAVIDHVSITNTYVIGWDCGIIAANWGQNHWNSTTNFTVDGLWVEPNSRSLHHGASWGWAGVNLSMFPLFYTWDNTSGPFISGPQNITINNVHFDGYTINHTVIDNYWTVTFSNVYDSRGLITDVSQVDKSGGGALIINNSGSTPTPTPSGGTKYEAENGTLTGAYVGNWGSGWTGTGWVGGFDQGIGYNDSLPVTVSTAGSYNIDFRYSNGSGATQTLSVYVNGTKIKTVSFAPTGAWDSTWATVTSAFTLNAGSNTIKIQHDSGDGPTDIDYIVVK